MKNLRLLYQQIQKHFDDLFAEMNARGEAHDVVTIHAGCGQWTASFTICRRPIDGAISATWQDGSSAFQSVEIYRDKSGAVRGNTPDSFNLREIDRAILESLKQGQWSTVSQCARGAGYTTNSYFRGAIAKLIKLGLIERNRRRLRRKD
jgi:hypothetical protein